MHPSLDEDVGRIRVCVADRAVPQFAVVRAAPWSTSNLTTVPATRQALSLEGGMEAEKAVQFPIDRAHSVNEDVRTKKGNVRIGVSSQKKT